MLQISSKDSLRRKVDKPVRVQVSNRAKEITNDFQDNLDNLKIDEISIAIYKVNN